MISSNVFLFFIHLLSRIYGGKSNRFAPFKTFDDVQPGLPPGLVLRSLHGRLADHAADVVDDCGGFDGVLIFHTLIIYDLRGKGHHDLLPHATSNSSGLCSRR